MLSKEENDLLTQIGPGTPMGELARRFWTPVLLASELPAADCDPVRVRALGEDVVAFKDSNGRVGLLEAWCPHRGSDLFFGRNEEGGLRCVYHGWKFDAAGACLDVPNAPEGESFREKVRARAYPALERGGLVWGYFGPPDSVPDFPEMEWTRVPDAHRYISKMFLDCNYLQTMEADIDSSHLGFLHSYVKGGTVIDGRTNGIEDFTASDRAPAWTVTDTDYGVMLTARRDAGDNYYWRVNQWMIPFYTMIAARPGDTVLCQVKVPVDDERSVAFRVRWHADRPLTPEELAVYRDKGVLFPEMIPGQFRTRENKGNDYLIDRAQQRHYSFTGIKSIPAQDFAVTEAQHGGPVSDRTRERLVSSDAAIIQVRRRLLRSVRQLQEGQEPPEARDGGAFRVRSLDIVMPKAATVEDDAREHLAARA